MRQESTDDYLTKPFVTGVLLARFEALLRRWRRRPRSTGEPQQGGARVDVVRFGDVEVSAAMRQVRINGEPVVLQAKARGRRGGAEAPHRRVEVRLSLPGL